MTGNHRFDSVQMFRHACSFADCADFCRQAPQSIVDRTKWYTAPKIANMAFACEIYMKTLLFYNHIPYKREHNLEKLYFLLPEKYRETIQQESIRLYGKMENAFRITYLNNVSEAFNEWRYSFEHDRLSIETGYLFLLGELLREMCCQELYNQSWDEYRGERNETM